MGPIPTVNITNYEAAHEIFVKNGKYCADRQVPPIMEHATGGHGLIFANGEEWSEMRKFTLGAFRKLGVGSFQIETKVMDELNGRCSEIDLEISKTGRAIVSVDFFNLTVGSVINSLLVGKRFDENSKEEFLTIKKLFDAAGETFHLFDMPVPVWILQWFFPRRYKLTMSSLKNVMDHVSREAVHRQTLLEAGEYEINSDEPKDFVDVFLDKMRTEKGEENVGHPRYSMESLKVVLQDLWQAGQGTTATTLYVGFIKLVAHPEIILKIREELLVVTQNHSRDVSLGYISSADYILEPGTLMAAQLGALHVNEELFENPDEFDPERYLRDDKLLQQIIPFGVGKRSCVGEQLAKAELYLVIANILLRYQIKPHGPIPTNEDIFPYGSVKLPDTSGGLEFTKY
ncbi:unnamed protein product [Caenorhabditis brenneri]